MKESNNTKIAGALILGAAIGAALGLLFAPDKGSETRKKMMKGAKDLGDKLSGKQPGNRAPEDPEMDRPV